MTTNCTTDRRITAPALTDAEWNEVNDALTIASDALGEGPADVDRDYLVNCCVHLRIALQRVHKVMGVMK